MEKIEGSLCKKIIFLALLFLGCHFFLYSATQNDQLLLSLSIAQASESELKEMTSLRNLPSTSVEQMRSDLYAYHQIEELVLNDKIETEGTYVLNIIHADSVTNDRTSSSLVILQGNAVVEFSLQDEEIAKKLSADKMIVDLENTLLSAVGSVVFEDPSEGGAVQQMTGGIVTLNWSSKSLLVTGGTTTTERKNSDDKDVRFFTTGELITYNGSDGGIFFDEGFITTNEKHAYSSISAKNLAFLRGGDLLVQNAVLSIGRVPVLWVPAFFFPGSRMVGNPAMGFASERGMFVNTTFEVYGTYPNFSKKGQNSFASLLSSEESADMVADGPLYRSATSDESTEFQNWAKKSGSYFVFFADAYELSGISLGFETKNGFFEKKLILDSNFKIAIHPDGVENITSYQDFPTFRYMGDTKLTLDTSWADMTIQLPLYSDPKVKRLYANRLTSFSFDSLLGSTQEFPTDYLSDITSFTWNADGTFDLSSKVLQPYVSSFKITTMSAKIKWAWKKPNDSYNFFIQEVTLPELKATLSGELFSLSRNIGEKTTSSSKDLSDVEQLLQEEKERWGTDGSLFSLNPNLDEPYRKSIAEVENSATEETTTQKQSISLGYTIDEKFIYSLEADSLSDIDWNSNSYLYNLTKPSIKLEMVLHPKFFTFTQTVVPQITRSEDRKKDNYLSQQIQITASTEAAVPLIGLTYTLSERLYTYTENYYKDVDDDGINEYEYEEKKFKFTKEFVTTHQLKLSKSFPLNGGSIAPSVIATLYPLTQSLLPGFSLVQGHWTFTNSFKFLANKNNVLEKNLLTSLVQYKGDVLTFSLKGTYQFADLKSAFWDPFTLQGSGQIDLFEKQISLKESFSYEVLSSTYGSHYFTNITTTLSLPSITSTLVYIGPSDDLKISSLTTKIAIKEFTYSWWKQRMTLTFGLDSSLSIDFIDTYATSLSITAKLGFSIAEFLDLSFSVKSSNSGFYAYYDASGNFSLPLMWADLQRSFDFFGNGRRNTQFNMNSISLELIHYMEDWSLNCKYTGSVVLSNKQYSWVPVVSVFLQWNTIPELKVDEKWTESSNIWSRTSST